MTQSLVVGIDRQLVPNLAVQVNYSWTRTHNYMGNGVFNPWVGLTPEDYARGRRADGHAAERRVVQRADLEPELRARSPPTATAASSPTGMATRAATTASRCRWSSGSSNRWMARVGGAWNNMSNGVLRRGPAARQLRQPDADRHRAARSNGGPFVVRSAASGAATTSSTRSGSSAPTASTCCRTTSRSAASLFGRQGYPFPVYRRVSLGTDGSRRVLVSPELDSMRLDNLWNLDLRAATTFRFGAHVDRSDRGRLQRVQREHGARAQPQLRLADVPGARDEPQPAHPAVRRAADVLIRSVGVSPRTGYGFQKPEGPLSGLLVLVCESLDLIFRDIVPPFTTIFSPHRHHWFLIAVSS